MAAVPPFRPGQPILAKDLNNLAGQANAGAAWNPDEAAFEGGRSGRANNSTPPYRAIATFEISSEFEKSTDLDDNPDDVESCEAKVLRFLSQSNTYEGSDLERKERLYRVAAGADLVVGDHATAWLNQQSGRWEIICGGPSGGSSSEACRMGFGGIPWSSLPGRVPNTYQFLLVSPDDCLMLVGGKPCNTSSSSSSSSSSDSNDAECVSCEGSVPTSWSFNDGGGVTSWACGTLFFTGSNWSVGKTVQGDCGEPPDCVWWNQPGGCDSPQAGNPAWKLSISGGLVQLQLYDYGSAIESPVATWAASFEGTVDCCSPVVLTLSSADCEVPNTITITPAGC